MDGLRGDVEVLRRDLAIVRGDLEAARRELATVRRDLEARSAELIALNALGIATSSTLDLDMLIDRALGAIVGRLPFDRAAALLVEPDTGWLAGGRLVGGDDRFGEDVATLRVSLQPTDPHAAAPIGAGSPVAPPLLARLAGADGPMVFRGLADADDPTDRALGAALAADSVLGTPLVTKGRTVGVLVVGNRLTGRDAERATGPLLFTLGNLLAAAIDNARLYGELETYSRELEARVARRTEQLARAVEEAQAARAQAETASAAKGRFLATVSHELRTPLTSVVGFAKLVRKRLDEVVFPALGGAPGRPAGGSDRLADAPDRLVDGPDPKVERAMRQVTDDLAIIVAEGERLTALVNDVLDLEKIEAGRMTVRQDTLDVGSIVGRATDATAPLFEASGLALEVDVAPDLPVVIGDRDRLIQVLVNLLSNAVKFTAAGSVTVRVRLDGTEVRVEVADTGIGIDPADHERVFEQFAQSTATLADGPRGTGLGLPIARQIVEHHGGRMWLTSEPGVGTTVRFNLPVAAASPAARRVDAAGTGR